MIMLLPLQKDRAKIEDAVENFSELVSLQDRDAFVDPNVTADMKKIRNSKPCYKNGFLARYLIRFPFFKRLSEEQILELLGQNLLSVEELDRDDILHISGSQKPSTENCFIVLNGKILMKDHYLDEPYNYNIMQIATQGSCVGVAKSDFGNTCLATVWGVVHSCTAHVVKMSVNTIEVLLKCMQNREKEIMRGVLH